MAKKAEWRDIDVYGPVRLMAEADGYAMVRRARCIPFVIDAKRWHDAPVAKR